MRDLASIEIILQTVKSFEFQRLLKALARLFLMSDIREVPDGLLLWLTVFDLSRLFVVLVSGILLGLELTMSLLMLPMVMVPGVMASDSSCTANISN